MCDKRTIVLVFHEMVDGWNTESFLCTIDGNDLAQHGVAWRWGGFEAEGGRYGVRGEQVLRSCMINAQSITPQQGK